MERLSKLLFELSNENRLSIIVELEKSAMKLTALSRKLEFTVQETSRHLSRLSGALLVMKDVDGSYHITPLGKQTIEHLSGLEFLANHSGYFKTHTPALLPREFASRIGDLVKCGFSDNVMQSFGTVESMIKAAEEYIWIASDYVLSSTLPLLEDAGSRGLEFKTILPENLLLPAFSESHEHPFSSHGQERLEHRTLKKIDTILVLSEKNAVVTFPTIEGKMDYLGFETIDELSHTWCKNLFQYYWERAVPFLAP
jgi:predicted transcriptional regulator